MGKPQDWVLDPLLQNVMYKGFLALFVPEEANFVGFADDVAVVITAKILRYT